MPTAKPRITITLTDHQHSVLSTLAQAQKVSMSSIVVDLVDTTLPVLERLSAILQNAADAPQSVLDNLRRSLSSAETDTAEISSQVMGQLDLLADVAAGGRSRGALATRGRALAAAKPPTSNRGVRITSPTSKIGSISPMKKGEKNGRAEK
jgi:hypothetical protein